MRPPQKWISFFLMPNRSFRPMTRINCKIVAERNYVAVYRIQKLLEVSTGQIRSPDRAFKQAVAYKNGVFAFLGQNNVAASVARTMQNLELQIAELIYFAMLPISRQFRRIFILKPKSLHLRRLYTHEEGLPRKSVVKILVVLMQNYMGFRKAFVHRGNAANVIQVAVS